MKVRENRNGRVHAQHAHVVDLSCSAVVVVTHLRCEYLENPLGVDVLNPRLSWVLQSDKRAERQTAYHVLVSGSPERLAVDQGELWDSGRIESDSSAHVEYAGQPLVGGQECYWKVRVWETEGRVSDWSRPGRWSMGLLDPEDWAADWIGGDFGGGVTAQAPADQLTEQPCLRKVFVLDGEVRFARLYVASLGFHALSLNGRPVGDHLLDPVESDFSRRVYYVTHDVSDLVEPGANALGAELGRGWYWQGIKGVEWDRPLLLLHLALVMKDGRRQCVVSDRSWTAAPSERCHLGGWRFGAFGGESVDARRRQDGWNLVAFDDTNWKTVATFPCTGRALSAQMIQPNRPLAKFAAQTVRAREPGEFLVDFGRNVTGWLRVRFRGGAGQEITFRYTAAHHDHDDPLEEHFGQVDRYTCRGTGEEEFCSRFNWRTFRYVRISGLDAPPALEDMEATLVGVAMTRTGSFACSDPLLNRLHETVVHTHRCLTLGGIQVDCPHRERKGYGCEGQGSLDQALYNFDAAAFYTKWARDFQDGQDSAGGVVAYTAPFRIFSGGGPAWSGACVVIPWSLYVHYGDRRILAQHYPAIRRWLDWLHRETENHLLKPHGLPSMNIWQFLGDWASPRREHDTQPCHGHWTSERENRLFNDCHHFLQVSLAARMAEILGCPEDARRWSDRAEAIRQAVIKEYFDDHAGRFSEGEQQQTSLAMPLLFNLVPEEHRARVIENLVTDIEETRQGHLDFGVFGGRFTLDALTREGRGDLIYRMATQPTWPGWGHMLGQGASTLWEHWLPGDSSVHNSFLSIGSWFYTGLAGIRPDPEAPGFKRVLIEPQFVPGIRWVKARYESIRGPVVVEWNVETETEWMLLDVSLPPNTVGRLLLPAAEGTEFTEGGRPLTEVPGVSLLPSVPGHAAIGIESGCYRFLRFRR